MYIYMFTFIDDVWSTYIIGGSIAGEEQTSEICQQEDRRNESTHTRGMYLKGDLSNLDKVGQRLKCPD